MPNSRVRVAGGMTAVGLALTLTAVAPAAVSAGTYTGTLAPPRNEVAVTVSLDAHGVLHARISDIPLYCPGGGSPIPIAFWATRVSRHGTFTAHAVHRISVGPLKGRIEDRLNLTGHFTNPHTVKGTLVTRNPIAPRCGGTSRFTAKRR
jgi:hypothetical protein